MTEQEIEEFKKVVADFILAANRFCADIRKLTAALPRRAAHAAACANTGDAATCGCKDASACAPLSPKEAVWVVNDWAAAATSALRLGFLPPSPKEAFAALSSLVEEK